MKAGSSPARGTFPLPAVGAGAAFTDCAPLPWKAAGTTAVGLTGGGNAARNTAGDRRAAVRIGWIRWPASDPCWRTRRSEAARTATPAAEPARSEAGAEGTRSVLPPSRAEPKRSGGLRRSPGDSGWSTATSLSRQFDARRLASLDAYDRRRTGLQSRRKLRSAQPQPRALVGDEHPVGLPALGDRSLGRAGALPGFRLFSLAHSQPPRLPAHWVLS